VVLPGVLSPAFFAFLASFDELLISMFLARVHAQTLPVRIWNNLNPQVEPTIAAVSGFLIRVMTLILSIEAVLPRHGQRRGRAKGPNLQPFATKEMARCVADPPQPVSLMITVSPSDMLRRVSLLSRIICRKTTVFGACTCISSAYATGQLRAKARWTESPLSSRAWFGTTYSLVPWNRVIITEVDPDRETAGAAL
jgi:hypothetical protein